jgi:hypothetical protein
MWAIIKIDRKKINFLEKDFSKKLGNDFKIYRPKLSINKYKKNKLINKEFYLLGDYILCFHKDFKNSNTINKLKYCRGLKYFLIGFIQSQNQIEKFVDKCKKSENTNGFLSTNFFQLTINSKYKFVSGPFTEKIFQIINFQKDRVNILMGNINTTIKKQEFLFNPA